jgi:uncharacterized tellurite resistance protein B-like protein
MNRFEELKNLLVMAAADGRFSSDEIQFLSLRAYRWGVEEEQFMEALEYAASDEAEINIPESKADRLELLTELMLMMAADGKLEETEKQLFARAAARMEISDDELNKAIDSLL